jgi:hypothetical protein
MLPSYVDRRETKEKGREEGLAMICGISLKVE